MKRITLALLLALMIAAPSTALAAHGSTTWYGPFFNDDDVTTDSWRIQHIIQVSNPNDIDATIHVKYHDWYGNQLSNSGVSDFQKNVPAHGEIEWRPCDDIYNGQSSIGFYGNYVITSDTPVEATAKERVTAYKGMNDIFGATVFHKDELLGIYTVQPQATGSNYLYMDAFDHTYVSDPWLSNQTQSWFIIFNPSDTVSVIGMTFRYTDTQGIQRIKIFQNLSLAPYESYVFVPTWLDSTIVGKGTFEATVTQGPPLVGYYEMISYVGGSNFNMLGWESAPFHKDGALP